ncbi:MAG TPA: OsmC family protein [Gammaproteobacteria bacterium]|jgi:organic hydroperoxide reductase OsmC/OhrA|nr:OsmC family protein [Gammaproteobacteria bacterium]
MQKSHPYQVVVSWSGARHGTTTSYTAYSREFTISNKGKQDILGSADKMFRGDPNLYNPEDLFISTIASCHLLWYLHLCAEKSIHIMSYIDEASGHLKINADGSGQFNEITLHPQVIIANKQHIELATQLHEQAHKKCFIANSVNFPVACKPHVTAEN